MFDKSNLVPDIIAERIKADFFKDVPVILDEACPGQRVSEGKQVTIGPVAGPEHCWTNLIHEMAHLVEIDINRINKFGWGLKYGKYWQIGIASGYEPQTDQAVLREARVWAFQANFQRHYGIETDVIKLVDVATWLSAFCYVKIPDEIQGYKNRDAARLAKIAKHVEENMKHFTMDMFRHEWDYRMQWLSIVNGCRVA